LARTTLNDHARAVRDYDRALQINPNVEHAAANKALAEKELGKAKPYLGS